MTFASLSMYEYLYTIILLFVFDRLITFLAKVAFSVYIWCPNIVSATQFCTLDMWDSVSLFSYPLRSIFRCRSHALFYTCHFNLLLQPFTLIFTGFFFQYYLFFSFHTDKLFCVFFNRNQARSSKLVPR